MVLRFLITKGRHASSQIGLNKVLVTICPKSTARANLKCLTVVMMVGVTLIGSRFLHGPEQRYAPIEGEALAMAWGIEQTRYFTQGCCTIVAYGIESTGTSLLAWHWS